MRRPVFRAGVPRSGFSLAEVVVAVLLLSVSLLAAGGVVHLAATAGRDADIRERLLWRAGEVADSLAAGRTSGSGEERLPDGSTLRWTASAGEGWVEALPPGRDSGGLRLPFLPEAPVRIQEPGTP